MLDPLYQIIGWLLAFFYGLVPNLGVAIILLTVTVMLLLFPLTAKQARSMLAMQEVQPELKKIQAKYKGDRQKLVEEQQKLFQEHKVNPLGGCLPLLAQFPVFISLFQVLRTTYKHIPLDSKLFEDLCGANQTVKACGDADGFPKHLEFLSMDLSVTPLNAEGGFFTVLPYFVLVALIVLTGLFQSRQTQRTTPKGGANPQMQMIGKVLPIVFGVISLSFPAGLCVYFLISNVWRLGQQEVIFRKIHLPHRERQEAKKVGGAKEAAALDVDSRPAAKGAPADEPAPAGPARPPAPSGPLPGTG
jgi:YidC/Oxa1 family membrane protein insertase